MSNSFDESKCNICKKPYTNPKFLQCFHVFCCECLHGILDSQNRRLSCKTCNESLEMTHQDIDALFGHLPFRLISDLQRNIEKINQDPSSILCTKCTYTDIGPRTAIANFFCIQCQFFFCEFDAKAHEKFKPTHNIVPVEDIAYRPISHLLPPQPEIYCKEHKESEINVYCPSCDVACCELCARFYHIRHEIKLVQDSAELLKKKIEDHFKSAREMLDQIYSRLPGYTEQMEQVRTDKKRTLGTMNDTFKELQDTIERRRVELETKISAFYDEQSKIIKNSIEAMSSFEKKISNAENHLKSSLEFFPSYYLFSISDAINSRLTTIKDSVPRKHLKATSIDFTVPSNERKEFENKIASIGILSQNTKTNFNNSQVLAPSNFGLSNDTTVHCISQDEDKLSILVSEKSDDSKKVIQKIHVIDPCHRNIESINQSDSIENPTQMAKMTSGPVLVTDSINRNVVVLNGNKPKRVLGEKDNLSLVDPVSISVMKQGEEKGQVAVYDKRTGEVTVLDKDLEKVNKIPVKEMPVGRQRKGSTSSVYSGNSSRSNSRPGSRMSEVSTDSGFAGSRPTSGANFSPVSVNSAVGKIKEIPSQYLATNSKNEIIIADEDDASYTAYTLEGAKIQRVDYAKHFEERNEKKPLVRANSNSLKPNVTNINTGLKRTHSVKRISTQLERSISPKTSRERTLITTDNLDNVYICRNKTVLTFDSKNAYKTKQKLPENIDPVSFLINSFGEAYILSSKGEIHLFERL